MRRRPISCGRRRGSILVQAAAALLAVLGLMALATDVTRLYIAAQRAQQVADAAAFAGGGKLPSETESQSVALGVAATNIAALPNWPTTCDAQDITYYTPGESIYRPDGTLIRTLGPNSYGLKVVAHSTIEYGLTRMFGPTTGTKTRYAVVVRGAASGMHCTPIWISEGTPELYNGGPPINLVKTEDAVDTNGDGIMDYIPPGSFGFLDFSVSGEDWFSQLLSGWDISPQVYEAAYTEPGQIVTAYTGEHTGTWVQALENQTGQMDGTARLERAAADPVWSTETFESHSSDNPRLMQISIVRYLDSNGTNAEFEVTGFAEMWLSAVGNVQGDKVIQAQFVEFHNFAGADGDLNPDISGRGGVFIVQPVE